MKNRSSRTFRQRGESKAMRRAFLQEAKSDSKLTPAKSDAGIRGYEFIQAFLSRGKQVVVV